MCVILACFDLLCLVLGQIVVQFTHKANIGSIFWKVVLIPVCRTVVHQSLDDLILSLNVF